MGRINGKVALYAMENMSDLEFDLLDELYFVQSYQYLQETLNWDDQTLKSTLQHLYDKAWINLLEQGQLYHYLATKAGLLAHNLR